MTGGGPLPSLSASGDWDAFGEWAGTSGVFGVLGDYLPRCRWFGARSREIGTLGFESVVRLGEADPVFLCVLSVGFRTGPPERYLLPLARDATGQVDPKGQIARLLPGPRESGGMLVDGFYLPETGRRVLGLFFGLRGEQEVLTRVETERLPALRTLWDPDLRPSLFRGEQSNTSLIFGTGLMLKCFRHLETGINPDLEVGAFLAGARPPAPIPPTGGALLSSTPEGRPLTLVLLQGYVENRGDGWSWMKARLESMPSSGSPDSRSPEEEVGRMVDRLALGTAGLHKALARDPRHPDFAPEPLGEDDLDRLLASVLDRLARVTALLSAGRGRFSGSAEADLEAVLSGGGTIVETVRKCRTRVRGGLRIRCHGDFHLGQVLVTPGEEVVFLDFEGEPALPLEERRVRTSPLQDVAGMLRSFHYLSMSLGNPNAASSGDGRGGRWFPGASARFLSGYLEAMEERPDLLPDPGGRRELLLLYLARKTLYEIEYEINNRPEWLPIPLAGLALFLDPDLLASGGAFFPLFPDAGRPA